MKISVISDMHLGYASGTERANDSFISASEAIQKSAESDAILLPGDIFDSKTPSTETLVQALRMTSFMVLRKSDTHVEAMIGKDKKDMLPTHFSGMPVIAIHGTHERRVKGLLNPVQAMERAGFLIHLHCSGVILRKGDERVCVQGISGVPDQFAERVLSEYNPKPVEGCFNILMLHQSVSPFLYAKDMVDADSLPEGFDLYVLGHIHDGRMEEHKGRRIVIAGSTVTTQINKDSIKPNGFWQIDTSSDMNARFIEIKNQRKVFIESVDVEKEGNKGIEKVIERILSETEFAMNPIIRIDISGNVNDVRTSEIKAKFEPRAIVVFKKSVADDDIPTKTLEEHRMSVQELGRKIMKDNMSSFGLDPELFSTVFDLLVNNKSDDVIEMLRKGTCDGRQRDCKESI